jgi:hypothetical protein
MPMIGTAINEQRQSERAPVSSDYRGKHGSLLDDSHRSFIAALKLLGGAETYSMYSLAALCSAVRQFPHRLNHV